MTRILIVSDIHANLAALDAVLSDAGEGGGFDRAWSLGDSVGYGPQPDECVAKLRDIGAVCVLGNHELVALGQISIENFNPYAAAAAEWTMERISAETRQFLETLPRKVDANGFTLVHGSPRDPVWEYMTSEAAVFQNLEHLQMINCAFGHTHVPAVFRIEGFTPVFGYPKDGDSASIVGARHFINPGSVGQPRDGDPRAAYALLDTTEGAISFHRVEYDIGVTQRLMIEAGLPDMLIDRLSLGR